MLYDVQGWVADGSAASGLVAGWWDPWAASGKTISPEDTALGGRQDPLKCSGPQRPPSVHPRWQTCEWVCPQRIPWPPASAFPAKASDITERDITEHHNPQTLCTQLVQVLSHHLFRVISYAATVTGTHSDDYNSSNTVKNGGQLLRLSMAKSKISLGKRHTAFEIMGVIFKSLLILLSSNSSDITADSVWTFVPGFMFLWDSLVVSLVPPWQQIICSNCRRLRFDPWLRKIPWTGK